MEHLQDLVQIIESYAATEQGRRFAFEEILEEMANMNGTTEESEGAIGVLESKVAQKWKTAQKAEERLKDARNLIEHGD